MSQSGGVNGQPLAGRVALITGGARGQGRSHAVELARLGADLVLTDLCDTLGSVPYPMGTADDLAETVRMVEDQDRRCLSSVADVRDLDAMIELADRAVAELGSVDILVANAGICSVGSVCTMDATQWDETIGTNLTGVFNAMRSCAPHMRRNRWGRIIGISSMMGRSSNPGIPAYVASKWGVIGLCKSVAFELAAFGVTVNAIAPGNVSTPMIHNEALYTQMRPDLEHPTRDDVATVLGTQHVQPVPWIDADEITAAVVYLTSEAARHITGSVIDIDAGASARFTG